MKHMMAAELSGDLLRVALYELIPNIEDGKRYVVTVDQVDRSEKITMHGNDLSMPVLDDCDEIDHQALNHPHLEPAPAYRADIGMAEVYQNETVDLEFDLDAGLKTLGIQQAEAVA